MIAIIITLIALGIVIFVHELGHMLIAKASGIGVLEFSIGMGPKVFSKKIKETTYSLRAFPVGGFVSVAGLDTDKKETIPDEINYYKKPFLNRFFTIASGSLVNILFGFLIFLVIFSLLGVPQATTTIDKIMPNSPAEKAGLVAGDKIIKINSNKINKIEKDFIPVIQHSGNKVLTIEIIRNSEPLILKVIPEIKHKKLGRIGIYFETKITHFNPISAFSYSIIETGKTIKLVFVSLWMLVRGEVSLNEMAGPIGIIQLASFQLNRGLLYFLNIMAIISISLGVINLFPFPILDGGHLVLLCLEFIMKKPLNQKIESIINNTGAVVLISLMILIIINDIFNWSSRVQLLQKITN